MPKVGDETSSSAFKQESTSQAFVMTDAVNGGQEMKDAKAPSVEDNGFPHSAQGQALTSPKSANSSMAAMEMGSIRAPVEKHEDLVTFPPAEGRAPTSPSSVMEKVCNDQAPDVEGRKFSSAEVHGSASSAFVKTHSAMKERKMAGIKAPAVTDHGLPIEDQPSSISPASVKPADNSGGVKRPVAKGQEKPAKPSATEKAQPLATAVTGPRDVTRNRAERKGRQAMVKLGLHAVSEVFPVTMKSLNGNLLVVKKFDVFRHP